MSRRDGARVAHLSATSQAGARLTRATKYVTLRATDIAYGCNGYRPVELLLVRRQGRALQQIRTFPVIATSSGIIAFASFFFAIHAGLARTDVPPDLVTLSMYLLGTSLLTAMGAAIMSR